MATVKLVNINKIYDGGFHAVHDFSVDIADKEFIAFVGPSGCGKSTTLRMVAGLEEITTGELYIDGKLMNNAAPKDRDIAMVFQSYALYPQMTVYNNMAYALRLRKIPKAEIDRRVREAAEILKLTPFLNRKPRALSGGQRQRVALGRSIVRRPKVFLMDEPLSNLDAKLRVAMRSEIVRIHREVGATTIYVTHDQIEAMTMANRIVVMRDGYIQQIGTPDEVYGNPTNMFVAGFIGTPAMNFLNGLVKDGVFYPDNTNETIQLTPAQTELLKNYNGKRVVYGIRPENLLFSAVPDYEKHKDSSFKMKCGIVEKLGDTINVHGTIGGKEVVMKMSSKYSTEGASEISVAAEEEYVHFFNESTTYAITADHNEYEEKTEEVQEEAPAVEEQKKGFFAKIASKFKKSGSKKKAKDDEHIKDDME